MNSIRLKLKPLAASAALLLILGVILPIPARAVDKTWTAAVSPVWETTVGLGNWTGVTPPGLNDTAIFGAQFTPDLLDAALGARTDGSEVLLGDTSPGAPLILPPPRAANLVFLNDWMLTQRPGNIPVLGYAFSGLVLSQGDVTVAPFHTATINADITVLGGELTKLGDGKLLLEQTVTGNVVNREGALGGNFTTTGNLTNYATLAPGNSPGTITVKGSFYQKKSGTLALEIASPSSFDHLNVGGDANLRGDVDFTLLDGYRPKKGRKFTFLNTEGKVRHQFESVDAPVWDLLTLRLFYGKRSVTAEAVVASFAALPGLTANQRTVARDLDRVIYDPQETKLIHYLYTRDLDALPKAFDKIAPEELTSIFAIGTSLATVQSLNIQRRTDDLRSGANGFNASGLALNGNGPGYNGPIQFRTGAAGPSGKESKEIKDVAPVENRWGAFLTGTGEWVNVGDTGNARGYDLTSGGFTLGVDYKVTSNFAIGLAAGYTGTTADLTDRGRVWVNGGKLGLYATFFENRQASAAPAPTMSKDASKDSSKEAPAPLDIGGGFYADVAVFGGYNSYDTRRSALQGEARGDTDGGELNVLFGTGYDIKKGALTFGPTATFNYTYLGTDGFNEHGSLAPLDIHGGEAESLRTAFGLKASYDWNVGGMLIKPEIRTAWQHEYGDASYDLTSSLANGGGNPFLVSGPKVGRDSLLLGAGFAVQFNERASTYFYYDGDLGRSHYQATNVTGGFRLAF